MSDRQVSPEFVSQKDLVTEFVAASAFFPVVKMLEKLGDALRDHCRTEAGPCLSVLRLFLVMAFCLLGVFGLAYGYGRLAREGWKSKVTGIAVVVCFLFFLSIPSFHSQNFAFWVTLGLCLSYGYAMWALADKEDVERWPRKGQITFAVIAWFLLIVTPFTLEWVRRGLTDEGSAAAKVECVLKPASAAEGKAAALRSH